MTQANTVKNICSKCDGHGSILGFAHIENGVCFDCKGTGRIANRRLSRAYVISEIKSALDRVADKGAEYGFPFITQYDESVLRTMLINADVDVHARATAAIARIGANPVQVARIGRA